MLEGYSILRTCGEFCRAKSLADIVNEKSTTASNPGKSKLSVVEGSITDFQVLAYMPFCLLRIEY